MPRTLRARTACRTAPGPRWTPLSTRLVEPLERRLLDAAEAIVTHSEWAAESVCSYGIDPARVHVIPFGISVPPSPLRSAPPVPEITFVGATMERKGGWWLLDVFRRRLADHCTLNVVTAGTVPQTPSVRVYNDLLPGDSKLEQILARTSVFVFPSEIDPFGYTADRGHGDGGTRGRQPHRCGPGDRRRRGDRDPRLADEEATVDAILTLLTDDRLRRRIGRARTYRRARALQCEGHHAASRGSPATSGARLPEDMYRLDAGHWYARKSEPDADAEILRLLEDRLDPT